MNRLLSCRRGLVATAIATLVTLSPSLGAQESSLRDTLRLSLDEAVAKALEESEEIQVARSQVDQARSQITQATAAALPHLSANFTYNRTVKSIFDDIQFFPEDDTTGPANGDGLGDLPFGRPNTYLTSLQLTQLLWAGGSVGAARRAATLLESAAENQLEEAESDIVFRVRTAYLNAVAARRLHEIALQSQEVALGHLRQVESFRQAGTASEFDLLRARVDYENRNPAVVQTDNAAQLAALELKRLVNVPAEQPLELTTRGGVEMVQVDESVLAGLVADRPVLRAARENVGMREAAVTVFRAQRWPSVSLLGNLGFQAFPSRVTPPGFDQWRKDWYVALGVSWNVFNGFETKGQIAQAQAQLRQARVEEVQLNEALTIQLEAGLADYRMAIAQLEAREETVALAERAYELAESRFANGLSTQLEVSDAALLLDEARVNQVQAMYDYVKALAQLERLSGGRLQLLRFR
jgi:outer membrane protein TolC